MKIMLPAAVALCLLMANETQAQTKSTNVGFRRQASIKKVTDNRNRELTPEEKLMRDHPEVVDITWEKGDVATLTKKDGTKEVYRMDMLKDETEFRSKYGYKLHRSKPYINQKTEEEAD